MDVEAMKRDPRLDPQPGDVLHLRGFGGGCEVRIESVRAYSHRGPCVRPTYIKADDGRRVELRGRLWSLPTWRIIAEDADVLVIGAQGGEE